MARSAKQFELNKQIWTEADFDTMNWHDNTIHAITFSDNFELLLDIEYIFKWVLKAKKYIFWASPCTLVFENVYDLTLDIGPTSPGLTIDFLRKPSATYKQPAH